MPRRSTVIGSWSARGMLQAHATGRAGIWGSTALRRLRDQDAAGEGRVTDGDGVEPRALGPNELRIARALADVATIGILQERAIRRRGVVAEQLQLALNSRVIIEQAKGVLAERGELETERAFELLRGHARSTQQRLSDVALGVVNRTIAADVVLGPLRGSTSP